MALMLIPVWADAGGLLDAMVGSLNTTLEPTSTNSKNTGEAGIPTSEVLPGNGTRAGYVLGHGNIIPGSEWVDIGTGHAQRTKDYAIDYASGTIFFVEPIRQMDSVRVDYRYSEKGSGQRSVAGPGLMALKFGNAVEMNMLYSYRATNVVQGMTATDVLTYGMNITNKLSGSSSLSSMFYVATPQSNSRMSFNSQPGPAQAQQPAKVKKDQMIVENADLGLGKVRLKLGYQDVGKDFAGFASLRDSKAAANDVLNQLEKEKGLKRMDLTGELPTGEDTGLSFAIGRIEDASGNIMNRSFGFTNNSIRFNYMNRNVDRTFSRFKDLKEADRGQYAAEAGMNRTSFGLQFRTGLAQDKKTSIWSGINFTQLTGDTGSLSYRTADLDMRRVKVEADVRTADPTFNRFGALTDEERTRMALIARRQFNPAAKFSDVTAADKAQINNEAGLDRSTCIVQVDGGPVDTWLTLSNVGSQQGSVNRRAINVSTDRASAYFNTQTIDKGFARIVSLQPIEQARYGNEFGMTRTEMGGRLKLLGGDAAIDSATVIDHQGAGLMRQAIDYKNPRLKFHANFQNIDHNFSRIMDLSDADRNTLLQDQGFKRSDYSINFQATKALNIDSYVYDSTNPTAGQTRNQSRHKITFAPQAGPKITAFIDNYAYVSENGVLGSYYHREINYDNAFKLLGGLLLRGRNNYYVDQANQSSPTTTMVTENHLESNQKAKTSFTLDVLNTDHGDGRSEETQAIGFKSMAAKNFALTAGFSSTARTMDKSETNGRFGFEWAIRKDLKLTYSLANRDGGSQGSQQASQYSLNGPLAKRFLIFDNINIASGTNMTQLRGKQIGCDNAIKLSAGMLGGNILFDNTDKLNPKNGIYYTSRIFQYESCKDPKLPYHITFFRQNLITPAGTPAKKRNYALDVKLPWQSGLTLTSYFGKDGQNGAVIPVGGTVFKFSHLLGNGNTIIADYSHDINQSTLSDARVMGLGISGNLPNKASYEIYYGWCRISEGISSQNKNIFRLRYDSKIDANRYITFTLQRKSGVDKTTINPYEGDTVGRIDFQFLFD